MSTATSSPSSCSATASTSGRRSPDWRRRPGVELSERTASEDRRKRRLREALEAAIAWYREVLLQARQAERARAYLAERGLSEETLERFGIGYALNNWEALAKRLRAKGFSDTELTDAGLASPSTRGGVYDRFRGRIIIPIRDASGRAIGLGGRILPDAEGPKYLNSPATALFDKSRTLYGIDLAKGAIRREKLAVIVEGYTDVMAAHQAGFGNVVASLGTALTRGRWSSPTATPRASRWPMTSISPARPPPSAGCSRSSVRVVSKVRVIRIPAGKDPDELIRTDPDGWRAAVEPAEELLPYFMQRAASEVDLRQPHGRSAYTRRDARPAGAHPGSRSSATPTSLASPSWRASTSGSCATSWHAGPRPMPIRPIEAERPIGGAAGLGALEREALMLLLLNPALAAEHGRRAAADPRQFRAALAEAWIGAGVSRGGRPELDAFVSGLDPVTGRAGARPAGIGARANGAAGSSRPIARRCASACFACGRSSSRTASPTFSH